MPKERKKDEGTGAPVLDLLSAHVRLIDVEEHEEPFTVTREKDGRSFELDPGFYCTVEIVDDGEDGSANGAKFFEKFKYKYDEDADEWFNSSNSKLGMLTEVRKPGYFEDTSIPALTADDLEGFELRCQVKPKYAPDDKKKSNPLGSTIDWESMRALKPRKRVTVPETDEKEDDNFEDIPF